MDESELEEGRHRAAAQRSQTTEFTYERHRNWHVSSLGADLLEYGLTGFDADAMMGLRCVPVTQFRDWVDKAISQPDDVTCIGDLLKPIIDQRRGDLEALGQQASWERRRRLYHADLAHWRAQPDSLKEGRWREKPMTPGQRALMQVTATALGVAIPPDLTRGTASDWLDGHGANLTYRPER
jgi:hypothetical protein